MGIQNTFVNACKEGLNYESPLQVENPYSNLCLMPYAFETPMQEILYENEWGKKWKKYDGQKKTLNQYVKGWKCDPWTLPSSRR